MSNGVIIVGTGKLGPSGPGGSVASVDGATGVVILPSASEATRGLVRLATPAQVVTGTDDELAVTSEGVAAAFTAFVGAAPAALNALVELAAAIGNDPNFAATLATQMAGKQNLNSALTAISALTTTPFGRGLLEVANDTELADILASHFTTAAAALAAAVSAVADHEVNEINVHGIPDTANLETQDGAQDKADAAYAAAIAAAVQSEFVDHLWLGTRAEYTAVDPKDAETFYVVSDDPPPLSRIDVATALTPTTGSTAIDFDVDNYRTHDITGNVTYTTANRASGKFVTIKVLADGSTRTLTFPAWVFVGNEPTSIAAGKTGMLTLRCFGSADTDIVAAWAVEL